MRARTRLLSVALLLSFAAFPAAGTLKARAAGTGQVVLIAQNEELDAYSIDAKTFRGGKRAFVGKNFWVNGPACYLPKDPQHRFFEADDDPKLDGEKNPWWGLFTNTGKWTGKKVLVPGMLDPAGCAFDARGNFIGVDVGGNHTPTQGDGKVIEFFAPDFKRSCIMDKGLSQPGMIAFDAQGRLYVPESGNAAIYRYSSLPRDPRHCSTAKRETWFNGSANGIGTPIAIVRAPGGGWAVSSVLVPSGIFHVSDGGVVDDVYAIPSQQTGTPFGLAFDKAGNLYYADLAVSWTGDPTDPIGPIDGAGALKMVRAGGPPIPETIKGGMSFPDGVTVVPASWIR